MVNKRFVLLLAIVVGRIATLARCGLLLQMEERGLLVCLSVTTVSPAKAAEPIVMTFGMLTEVGLGTMSRYLMLRGNLEGVTSGFPCMLSTSLPTGRPQNQSSVTLIRPMKNLNAKRPLVKIL